MLDTFQCPICAARFQFDLEGARRYGPARARCPSCACAFGGDALEATGAPDAPIEDFNGLMGALRSRFAEPFPRATEIVLTIKAWPNAHEREVAGQYAFEHFARIGQRDDVVTHRPREGAPMHYDPSARILSSPNGQHLKEMCCPLEKRWAELEVIDAHDMARICADCDRHVFDTRGMDAPAVRRLVAHDPEACLHIDQSHGNVVFMTKPIPEPEQEVTHDPEDDPNDDVEVLGFRGRLSSWVRRLRGPEQDVEPPKPPAMVVTARSLLEINLGVAMGLRPLIKRTAAEPWTASLGPELPFLQVWQNTRTREVAFQVDPRHAPLPLPYDEWEVVVPAFRYEDGAMSPVGAYLLPEGIEPGTTVFVDSVLHTPHMLSEGPFRRYDSHGVWDGRDIEISYYEDLPVVG